MDSKKTVKLDLLRRKYLEHFRKHPKSKSVLIKADVGNTKTIWRVVKEGRRDFRIVEVNTSREEFVISEGKHRKRIVSEVSGQASPAYQQLSTLVVKAMMNPGDQRAKEEALNALERLRPQMKLDEQMEAEKIRGAVASGGATVGERDTAQSFRQSSPIPGLGSRPATRQTASRKRKGRKMYEAEGQMTLGPDEAGKKKGKEKKKHKPHGEPEAAAQDQALDQGQEKVDKPETELGTGDPDEMGSPTPPEGTSPPEMKSAEEERLQKLVHNKPLQNISVSGDNEKGTITLELGGLNNPIEIKVHDSGKITYTLGNLSQVLRPGA